MSKGRNGTRERRARKYFRGGTMPDGLELFPLNGGKMEIMQEVMEAAAVDYLSDDQLGNCMMMIYASQYSDIKDMYIQDLAEGGREVGLNATLEDRQAAEEVIVGDFDALTASIASSPKQKALMREGQSRSNGQTSSGQGSLLDTPGQNSTQSPSLRSSKSPSQTNMQTEPTGSALNGQPLTTPTLKGSGKNLTDSETVTG